MSTITAKTTVFERTPIVWNLYTQSKHIINWYVFSQGWECKKVECEIKSGGNYSAKMESIDGSSCFELRAIFDEIIPMKVISYTLNDGRKVRTTFEDLDGATKVQTTFDSDQHKPENDQQDRWSDILNSFKNYVEKGSV